MLLAAPGAIVLRALPNHLLAQRTVMDLARPAEDMVVVFYLVTAEIAVFPPINISVYIFKVSVDYRTHNMVFR